MRILILGSLGANQDRVMDLVDAGHEVTYVFTQHSEEIAMFGATIDCIPVDQGRISRQISELVHRKSTEIVYSLVSSYDGSLQALQELITAKLPIGIVRHYKEHSAVPYELERRSLLETDGQIYANLESFCWFRDLYSVHEDTAHIMDADLISARYMRDDFQPKLRNWDGRPHMLVGGSVSILDDRYDIRVLCTEMAQRGVAVHIYASFIGADAYGNKRIGDMNARQAYIEIASKYELVTLHSLIRRSELSLAWSQYDGGFLHARVGPGDPSPAYERLNTAHRYSSYLAAGLPLLIPHGGHDAMEAFVSREQLGLVYQNYDELADWLWDAASVEMVSKVVQWKRKQFSFGAEVPRLVAILGQYIR